MLLLFISSATCSLQASKFGLQYPFRTDDLPFPALDPPTSHHTSPCQRFESAFGSVMIIRTSEDINVKRDSGLLGPTIQPMMKHVTLQLTDIVMLEFEFTIEERP